MYPTHNIPRATFAFAHKPLAMLMLVALVFSMFSLLFIAPLSVAHATECSPYTETIVSDSSTQVDGSDATVITPHPAWTTIAGASWIWDQSLDEGGSAPEGTEEFTREFSILSSPTESSLEIASDNTYTVSVNGNPIDTGTSGSDEDNFSSSDTWVIPAEYLLSGVNTLAVTVTNSPPPEGYTGPNPGGLDYALTVNSDGCETLPETVSVTIAKYIDGEHATAENANSALFPFIADYDGTVNENQLQGSDPYEIGPTGNNTTEPYEAKTLDFDPGADYGTHEVTGGDTVGESCEEGKPFALTGYTWGETMQEAQEGTPSETAPAFTDLQSNKYVIVWNEDCAEPQEPGTVTVTINKFIDGVMASSTASSSPSFPMSATWSADNIGSGTGSYTLSATGFNSANPYQAVTAEMSDGADYTTNETFDSTVGASCAAETPYALSGYKSGNTLGEAMSSTSTPTAPVFTDLQTDKVVLVLNVTCSNSGTIGGDVEGDEGVLTVTSIDSVDTSATADNTYENGWEYVFHVTVPTNESNVAMKFSDWTSGSSTIPAANNMRISSSQADNGGATITVLAADTYTIPDLHMTTDLNPSLPGIQVQIVVEVKIPVGTSNGSYTTNYGVKSQ